MADKIFDDILSELRPIKPKPAPDPRTRRGLFEKYGRLYIQAPILGQNKNRINALDRAVDAAIAFVTRPISYDEIPSDCVRVAPHLDIYIDCPDTELDPRIQPIIDKLAAAVKNGIQLNLHCANVRMQHSPIYQILVAIKGFDATQLSLFEGQEFSR